MKGEIEEGTELPSIVGQVGVGAADAVPPGRRGVGASVDHRRAEHCHPPIPPTHRWNTRSGSLASSSAPSVALPLLGGGDHDPFGDVATGQQIADLIPGSRFHVLPAAGHLPWLDDPANAGHLVTEFLQNHNFPDQAHDAMTAIGFTWGVSRTRRRHEDPRCGPLPRQSPADGG